MKHDPKSVRFARFRGIRFTVGLAFIAFAIGIVIVLGLLQFIFIKPYYRNSQINNVANVANAISSYLTDQPYVSKANLQRALEVTVNSNSCAVIYNPNGMMVYSADGIGSSCIFNNVITINGVAMRPFTIEGGLTMVDLLRNSEGTLSVVLSNEDTKQETILYGSTIKALFSNYYIFVNSPVEPTDALMSFYSSSFVVYTASVIVISIFVALILSKRLSAPFVSMTKSALTLAKGHYDVDFQGGYFNESRELAETLNDATEKLGKVDELRRDLIANVSHDIKTPLTMITAYAEMIRDISGDNPTKRNEHLEVILKESDFLNRLVTDMSELSKMQSGNYILTLSDFDMVETVEDMVDLCGMLLEKSDIHVHIDAPRSCMVNADEIKIGQVVYNFLTNAIKHSDEHSCIDITIIDSKDHEHVRVEVKDHGEGIDAKDIDHVWDRYYKIDKKFSRTSLQSTGLGLAIVKAILDCHHAQYGVTSEKGDGATFWFELPRIQYYGLSDQ